MDLKNFVSESLYQIIAGVKAAQEKMTELSSEGDTAQNNAYIAPTPNSKNDHRQHDIYFDIAVTVSKGEPAQTSARLLVMGLSVIGKTPLEHIGSLVSRVRFSVPVSYPHMATQKHTSNPFKHWH